MLKSRSCLLSRKETFFVTRTRLSVKTCPKFPALLQPECRRVVKLLATNTPSSEPSAADQPLAVTENEKDAILKATGVVFAVDDTPDAEEALRWTVANVLRRDERVLLLHVVCDPRAPQTAVGTTATGQLSYDALDFYEYQAPGHMDFQRKLQREAEAVVERRCVSTLKQAGVPYEVYLPVIPGAKSAGSIGEMICHETVGPSRLLVVTSHGPGLLAEYGSVARFCYQHSHRPLILIPGNVDCLSSGTDHQLLLVVTSSEEFCQLGSWVMENMMKGGESVVLVDLSESKDLALEETVMKQLKSCCEGRVEVVKVQKVDRSVDDVGQEVCDMAVQRPVRAMLMVNYAGKGMMQEMMLGSVTSYISKRSRKPLVLLNAP